MTRSRIRTQSLLSTTLAGLIAFSGCRGDENTCEYWTQQLGKQKREKQAVEKVAELGCQAATPALAELWAADSLYKREILTTVEKLGPSDGTAAIVKKAIDDPDYGPIALHMAVEWSKEGKVPTLAKEIEGILSGLVQSPKAVDMRREALKYLLAQPGGAANNATIVDTLIWVVGQDPVVQKIETNELAAAELGKVDWKKVPAEKAQAAAEKLIALHVRARYSQQPRGQTVQLTRETLRKVGPAAVDPVLRAFAGDDQELNELAGSIGIATWKYTHGFELVELLWDLGDRKASKPLVSSLGISLDTPPDVARLDEEQQIDWIRANQNRLSTTALTVGALPSDEAVGPALEILGRKEIPLDPAQFDSTGLALALIANAPAREGLWSLFRAADETLMPKRLRRDELRPLVEAEKDKIKRNELATEHDRLLDEIAAAEREKGRWVKNLAVSLSAAEVDAFKAEITDLAKGPLADAGKQPLPAGYLSIVAECRDDAACYVKDLQSVKGHLTDIPANIEKAGAAKDEAKKNLVQEAKPITAQIEAKEDELTKKSEMLEQMRVDFEEAKKNPKKIKELGKKNLPELADAYNAELEAYELGKGELKTLFTNRNLVVDKLQAFDDALVLAQARLSRLEKAALMLGRNPTDRKQAISAISETFQEGQSPYFQQFKQWALISLDRIATPEDLPALEALRKHQAGADNLVTYATIRLDAIMARLQR